MEVVVAIIAGLFSISVAIFGAAFINVNNIKLQTRKLKEEHYVRYIEAKTLLRQCLHMKKRLLANSAMNTINT